MAKSGKATIDGILNIDKPYGITSMDVVRRIKRASGQRRVGHGGTLDPIATGVIPVCMGQATRLMEDVVGGSKSYLASVELGVSTDTYDALGEVMERRDSSGVTLADIEGALPAFVGEVVAGAADVQRAEAGRQAAVRTGAGRRGGGARGAARLRCMASPSKAGSRRWSGSGWSAGRGSTCVRWRTTWGRRWGAGGT